MALTQVDREDSYQALVPIGLVEPDTLVVSLTHDWGKLIVDQATAIYGEAVGVYTFDSTDTSSSGVHKIKWEWTIGVDSFEATQYIEIVQRYVTSSEFFTKYPDMEAEFAQNFNDLESVARKIIDTFCGQNFQFIHDGTLTFEGNGTKNQFLGRRLDTFTEVLIEADDVTSVVGPVSDDEFDRFIQFVSTESVERVKFTDGALVTVEGDWGYPYVPSSISAAAELLVLELMNDDRINYTHGIDQIWMDTQRTEFKEGQFDTTGNLDIDTLIMDYMILGWDYV